MIDKRVIDDPFRGIVKGSIVRIEQGPENFIGKDALVLDRELANHGGEGDPIEDWEANIEVLADGRRVKLWIGWVSKIVD